MVLNSGCPTDVTRTVELSGGHPLPRMVLNSGCPTDVTRAVELSGGHPLPRMVLNSGCPTDVTRAVELSGGQPLPRMVLIDLALVTATWQCSLNLAQLSLSELVVLISGIQCCRRFE